MQDENEQNPADSTSDDATSRETVSDVEETEAPAEESNEGGSSSPPSPDGEVNSDTSERSPRDDSAPM